MQHYRSAALERTMKIPGVILRALGNLEIQMIQSYAPQAGGRSERKFRS